MEGRGKQAEEVRRREVEGNEGRVCGDGDEEVQEGRREGGDEQRERERGKEGRWGGRRGRVNKEMWKSDKKIRRERRE